MLSPLKPLLCRHDFYWSERHLSERCRRCGKRQAVETPVAALTTLDAMLESGGVLIDFEEPPARPAIRSPILLRPGANVLKAQARDRREMLPGLLDRLVEGARPTREEAIDAVLALIEDAHSAEPVLFGSNAAGHFARLHEARSASRH